MVCSEHVRLAMALACDEAHRHNHVEIAPVHVLIALARIAHRVNGTLFSRIGLHAPHVLADALAMIVPGAEMNKSGKVPRSSEMSSIMERAQQEAQSRNASCVNSGHVLLALAGSSDEPSVGALLFKDNTTIGFRQAVAEALVSDPEPIPDESGLAHYTRFTDRLRHVHRIAKIEATRREHAVAGMSHGVYGFLFQREGVGIAAVQRCGVDLDHWLVHVVHLLDAATHEPEMNAVIQAAIEEARSMGHTYVGTEHFLLGALRLRAQTFLEVLIPLDMTLGQARTIVRSILSE